MTRLVLCLLLVSFTVVAFGQNYSGIGINLFPNLSHRRLVAFDTDAQNQIDSLEANEMARPSYAGGLVLSYRGKKAGVQVGLNYSQTGYRGVRRNIPFNDPQAANFSEQAYSFRSQQLEVPFSVLFYQALSDKDDFFFSLGSGLSYNLSNQDITTRYAGDISEREVAEAQGDFRRINYAFQTSMGWEHRFNDKWVMSVAPAFRLWLGGLYRDEPLNRNLYQAGLRVTFRFEREIIYLED
jgi:hypothetical protein